MARRTGEAETTWSDDDRALLQACLRGDGAAWETLIRRYRRLIYSIPFAYRLGPEAADEIFQRVAVRLFEHLGRIDDPERLGGWLATTTRRECWAFSRESARWTELPEGDAHEPSEAPPDVGEELLAVECEHAVRLALDGLGEPCRGLLTALYLEEPRPSYEELAQRLDRPIGSLGPTRARCLKKLRKRYDALGGPQELPDVDAEAAR